MNKKILIGSIFVAAIVFSMPAISTVQSQSTVTNINFIEHQEIVTDLKDNNDPFICDCLRGVLNGLLLIQNTLFEKGSDLLENGQVVLALVIGGMLNILEYLVAEPIFLLYIDLMDRGICEEWPSTDNECSLCGSI